MLENKVFAVYCTQKIKDNVTHLKLNWINLNNLMK